MEIIFSFWTKGFADSEGEKRKYLGENGRLGAKGGGEDGGSCGGIAGGGSSTLGYGGKPNVGEKKGEGRNNGKGRAPTRFAIGLQESQL